MSVNLFSSILDFADEVGVKAVFLAAAGSVTEWGVACGTSRPYKLHPLVQVSFNFSSCAFRIRSIVEF